MCTRKSSEPCPEDKYSLYSYVVFTNTRVRYPFLLLNQLKRAGTTTFWIRIQPVLTSPHAQNKQFWKRIQIKIIKENKIKTEIKEQYGFVGGKSTSNALFILWTLIEQSLDVKRDLYLCFIYYMNAFNRVRQKVMIQMLQKLYRDGKDTIK